MARVRFRESLLHTVSGLLGSLAEKGSFSLMVHSKQTPDLLPSFHHVLGIQCYKTDATLFTQISFLNECQILGQLIFH